ncbi:MAG: hypothetical protein OXI63_26340 [Candidatus Poribacteria bacterium]|nr:hypothetical protein [Candidatus Poribacteria bacterium]
MTNIVSFKLLCQKAAWYRVQITIDAFAGLGLIRIETEVLLRISKRE